MSQQHQTKHKNKSETSQDQLNPQHLAKEKINPNDHEEKEHTIGRPKKTNFEAVQHNFVYPPAQSELGQEIAATAPIKEKEKFQSESIAHVQPQPQLDVHPQHEQLQPPQNKSNEQKFEAAEPFLDAQGHSKINMDHPIHESSEKSDKAVWELLQDDITKALHEVKDVGGEFGGRFVEAGSAAGHTIAETTAPARESIQHAASQIGSSIMGLGHKFAETVGLVDKEENKEGIGDENDDKPVETPPKDDGATPL
jgi:hypothetical protein